MENQVIEEAIRVLDQELTDATIRFLTIAENNQLDHTALVMILMSTASYYLEHTARSILFSAINKEYVKKALLKGIISCHRALKDKIRNYAASKENSWIN